MKRYTPFLTAALVVSFSVATAFAQSNFNHLQDSNGSGGDNFQAVNQLGSGHDSFSDQRTGTTNNTAGDNTLRVGQIGNNQESLMVQETWGAYNNVANIFQRGSLTNHSNVRMVGAFDNNARISQVGNGNRLVGANTSGLLPNGPATQLDQAGSPGSSNTMRVLQGGVRNDPTGGFDASGNNNTIGLHQQTINITGTNPSNTARVEQRGDDNSAVFYQQGVVNDAQIRQDGNANKLYGAEDAGKPNGANAVTSGAAVQTALGDNTLVLWQTAGLNEAGLYQDALNGDNVARINQFDGGNTMVSFQYGAQNMLLSEQSNGSATYGAPVTMSPTFTSIPLPF
jgi:hypothetical protein